MNEIKKYLVMCIDDQLIGRDIHFKKSTIPFTNNDWVEIEDTSELTAAMIVAEYYPLDIDAIYAVIDKRDVVECSHSTRWPSDKTACIRVQKTNHIIASFQSKIKLLTDDGTYV